MSEKIDVNAARTYLHMADVNNDYIPLHPNDLAALATTVIEQAEQIKRLQAAVRDLIHDLSQAEQSLESEFGRSQGYEPPTLSEYITAEDMEDTDD